MQIKKMFKIRKNTHSSIYLMLIVVLLFINCKGSSKKSNDSIVIEFINLNIETPISISCNDFDDTFGKEAKKVTISDTNIIKTIVNKLEKIKAKNIQSNEPDVRVKINIHCTNVSFQTVCFGRFSQIVIDGRYYEDTESFTKYILSILPSK